MKPEHVWTYIKVGACFRYLQEATKGRPLHGKSFVIGNIERLFQAFDDFDLRVTRRAATKLKALYEQFLGKGEHATLSVQEAEELRDVIKEIRGTFAAEAKGVYTYIVTPKRLDTDMLINRMEGLFAPDTFEQLSEVAQYDFKEAGRCVAFARATAGAFHLMRGIEGLLRQYYSHFMGPESSELSWGKMTYELKVKKDKRIDKNTLKHVDHIRAAFRNPTQHPDKIYDIQEVQDLFFLAIDVSNRMVHEMQS